MPRHLVYDHADVLDHTPDQPVVRAIRDRLNGKNDNYRIGLVIEGGGMRGVVSGGMVAALNSLNIDGVFDRVYGVSAGGLNAAYYLTGRSHELMSVYYNELVEPPFISYWRLLQGGPLIAVDYLFEHVCEHDKPLDYGAILRSDARLSIQVTRLEPRIEPDFTERFNNRSDLQRALKASARIPGISEGPVTINGHDHVDGASLRSLVGDRPARDGCTHLLYLLTNPYPHQGGPSFMRRKAMNYLMRHYPDRIVREFHNGDQYHERISDLHRTVRSRNGPLVQCFSIPNHYDPCPQLEQDPDTLKRYAKTGARRVGAAFLPPSFQELQVSDEYSFYKTVS